MSRYGVIGGLTGVVAALISLRMGWGGVLDYAAGLALGAFTMWGLNSLVTGLGPGPKSSRHTLLLLLHLLKYPLVLVILYLLLVVLRRDPLLVLGGYTIALLVFLWRAGGRRARGSSNGAS